MQVHFHFQTQTTLKHRKLLKAFISNMFNIEKTKAERLSIIFCSDAYLLEINKQYLQHNYFTDIITFNLSPLDSPIEGEIYISVDTVRVNAMEYDVTKKEELHRVIFHGVLHLCGYGDTSLAEKKLMRQKEDKFIKRYFKTH